jgi:hypothetical protein
LVSDINAKQGSWSGRITQEIIEVSA